VYGWNDRMGPWGYVLMSISMVMVLGAIITIRDSDVSEYRNRSVVLPGHPGP
jgi:putative membrane protein